MSSGHEFSRVLFFFRRAHMIACDEDTAEAQIGPPPLVALCRFRHHSRTAPFLHRSAATRKHYSQPHCVRIKKGLPLSTTVRRPSHHLHIKNKPTDAAHRSLQTKTSRSAAIAPFARQDNQTANRISLRNCHPHKHHQKRRDPCDNTLPNDHAQRPSPAQFTLHTGNRSNTRRIKQAKYQKRQRRYRR